MRAADSGLGQLQQQASGAGLQASATSPLQPSAGSMGSVGFGALARSRAAAASSPLRPTPSYPLGSFDALSQLNVFSSRPASAAHTPMRSPAGLPIIPATPEAQSPSLARPATPHGPHALPPFTSPAQTNAAAMASLRGDAASSLPISHEPQHATLRTGSQAAASLPNDAASPAQSSHVTGPLQSSTAGPSASHGRSSLELQSSAEQPSGGGVPAAQAAGSSPAGSRTPAHSSCELRSSTISSQPNAALQNLHSAASSGESSLSGTMAGGSTSEISATPAQRIGGTTDAELRALAALSHGGRIASGASVVASPSKVALAAPAGSLSESQWAGLVTSPPSSPEPSASLHPPRVRPLAAGSSLGICVHTVQVSMMASNKQAKLCHPVMLQISVHKTSHCFPGPYALPVKAFA